MPREVLSQAELQHIEHCNKVLREHQELVDFVVNTTEGTLNTYLPILTTYIDAVIKIRTKFGEEVKHIMVSSKELRHITGATPEVMAFMAAAEKLDKLLTPEFTEKLRNIVKE